MPCAEGSGALLLAPEDQQLLAGVQRGELRALAKTITLIESQRRDHRRRAEQLLQQLLPCSGKAIRLGLSGVPGVGKSTFIEALGLYLIDRGHRVAVLAVDPSSRRSGGSILGDKTRMERLSQDRRAFIRPTPAGTSLGGVAERTREAIVVVEAAGFDVVIVETVGVGQSETAVAGMTDIFALLQLPNAGDELQGIKKGIMELADLIAVNKADLDPRAAARAQNQLQSAVRLLRPSYPDWSVPVLLVSAARQEGIAQFWDAVLQLWQRLDQSGRLGEKRRQQALAWLTEVIEGELKGWFYRHPAVARAWPTVEAAVRSGQSLPILAARQLLAAAAIQDE